MIKLISGKHTQMHRRYDMIVDLRFLPNPHNNPDLRELDGRHHRVQDWIKTRRGVGQYIDSLVMTIFHTCRISKGKPVCMLLTCAGGRHRSPAMAEILAVLLKDLGLQVEVLHLELQEVRA